MEVSVTFGEQCGNSERIKDERGMMTAVSPDTPWQNGQGAAAGRYAHQADGDHEIGSRGNR
jgi:hypothetical protein